MQQNTMLKMESCLVNYLFFYKTHLFSKWTKLAFRNRTRRMYLDFKLCMYSINMKENTSYTSHHLSQTTFSIVKLNKDITQDYVNYYIKLRLICPV